ncbi:predicted protein [Histoplasma capsulatum G186AR]|uniref:Uncharacterized protein n=1 Tax=Ajellomyces capsulatus (strain G186AR / H82 / ATCC MYA-2454 / RMSCC 2432) TaxID=447093 RepID=C0NGJ9_AJECG|nr:uncharacterized protein HCBG_02471 [Histoplasma capsulatum G186AR]EEH08934.1 predicted protein [Histoplasma capsulatum G186AR]
MESNRLIPLLILFVVVAILAVVGFVAWNIMMAVTAQTKKEMEKKNVSMSRDGMTVGVRELNDEEYKDISQGVLVNIWNYSSFPAYKRRWWNGGSDGSSS